MHFCGKRSIISDYEMECFSKLSKVIGMVTFSIFIVPSLDDLTFFWFA